MIIPAQTLKYMQPVTPFEQKQTRINGATGGLGPAGYDVSIAEDVWLWPFRFVLCSTVERFDIPDDVLASVHDKSTWARRGVAVQNTLAEPGWRGHLTLEITMHAWRVLHIKAGTPIAQIVFHRLELPTSRPYRGRYQDQQPGPQRAIAA